MVRAAARAPNVERPVEHVAQRPAAAAEVALVGELSAGPSEDLSAAIERLHRAVGSARGVNADNTAQHAGAPTLFLKLMPRYCP